MALYLNLYISRPPERIGIPYKNVCAYVCVFCVDAIYRPRFWEHGWTDSNDSKSFNCWEDMLNFFCRNRSSSCRYMEQEGQTMVIQFLQE